MTATATLANHGQRVRPSIVHAEQEAGSNALLPHPVQIEETVPVNDPKNWDTVINAMIDVVNSAHGTARHIGTGARYKIAGKTGTAQVFGLKQEEKYDAKNIEEKLRDNALFIAFAPADDPRIAVAVIIEHGGAGSSVAAPIARAIMDSYLLGGQS